MLSNVRKEVVRMSTSGNERDSSRRRTSQPLPSYGGFVPLVINSKQQHVNSINNTNNSLTNKKKNKHHQNNLRIHQYPVSTPLPSGLESFSGDILRQNISRFGSIDTADVTYSSRDNVISFPADSVTLSPEDKVKHTNFINKMKSLTPMPYVRPIDPTNNIDGMVSDKDSKMAPSVMRPTHSSKEEIVFGTRQRPAPQNSRSSTTKQRKKTSTTSTASYPSSILFYKTDPEHSSSTTTTASPSSIPTEAKAFASYSFSSSPSSYGAYSSSLMSTSSPISIVTTHSPPLRPVVISNRVEMPSSTTESELHDKRTKNPHMRVKVIEIPSTSSFYSPSTSSLPESTSPSSIPPSYSYSSPSSSTSPSHSYYSSYSSPSLLSSSGFDASSPGSSSSPSLSSFSFPTTLSDSHSSSTPFSFETTVVKNQGNDRHSNGMTRTTGTTTSFTTSPYTYVTGEVTTTTPSDISLESSNRHHPHHRNEAADRDITTTGAILEVIENDIPRTTVQIQTTTPRPTTLYSNVSTHSTPDPDLKNHQGYNERHASAKNKNKNDSVSGYSSYSEDTVGNNNNNNGGISYNPIYYEGKSHSISTDHTILNHILSLIAVGESPPEVKVFKKANRDGMEGAFSTHVEVHQRLPSNMNFINSRSQARHEEEEEAVTGIRVTETSPTTSLNKRNSLTSYSPSLPSLSTRHQPR